MDKQSLSEGIIIAGIPIFGYLVAFCYEAAFCDVFGIPLEFISLKLFNIFIAMGAIIGTLLLLVAPTDMIYTSIKDKSGPVFYVFIRLVLFPFLLFLLIFFTYPWGELTLFFFGILVLAIFVGFILPFFKRGEKTYTEKLKQEVKKQKESLKKEYESLFDIFFRKIGANAALGISILFLFLVATSLIGGGKALSKKEYLVIQTPKEITTNLSEAVALRIYGDEIIFAPFNRNTKEVERNFFIIKTADSVNLLLKLESVGPLKSKK